MAMFEIVFAGGISVPPVSIAEFVVEEPACYPVGTVVGWSG